MSLLRQQTYGTSAADLVKAVEYLREQEQQGQREQTVREPKSYFIDPYDALNMAGPRQKPGPISFQLLRYMADVPAIAAIINTRLNQVSNFCKRPENERDAGFRVTLKDKNAKMTDEDKKTAHEIEEFFLTTGFVKNKKRKDDLFTIMRKLTKDAYVLDAVALEFVPGQNPKKFPIAEMWAVDASTIEPVAETDDGNSVVFERVTTNRRVKRGEDVAYVQRINGEIKAEYADDELMYTFRNAQTDINRSAFGYSELEQLVGVVTAIMNGMHYNTSYFTQSNLPQGVLEIVGKYKPEHLEGFKRAWQTLVAGSAGRQWKVPVMALEEGQGFKFTNFKSSNRDMEYSQFMEFLHNLACAVFQIDPREVGFKSWDSGGSSKVSDNDAPATTIENSKDKGFYPLMWFFANKFSSQIVDRIDDRFCFRWTGLDQDRAADQWRMEKEQLDAGVLTVNRYLTNHDQPTYKDDWADLPANAVLAQYVTGAQKDQQQMQLQDNQHQNTMEAQFTQSLHQQHMARNAHQQQVQLQDNQHQNALEGQMRQGLQQSGLQTQKDQTAEKMQKMQHVHVVRQKFADAGHAKGMESMRQKGAMQQFQLVQQSKAGNGAEKSKLSKSLSTETLEIVIELV